MSYAIDNALRRVHMTIPQEVLEVTFEASKRNRTLDYCIHNDVIEEHVLGDCNLVAGKMTTIPLTGDMVEETNMSNAYVDPRTYMYIIYRIPEEARQGQGIARCISVDYASATYMGGPAFAGVHTHRSSCGPTLQRLACSNLQNAAGGGGPMSKPIPEKIGPDLIRLVPSATSTIPGYEWMLTCRLEYDTELTGLENAALLPFAQLVTAAVKYHVYNTLNLKIDKFYTSGGMEMGRMRDIVDSYSDQFDVYEDLLQKFRGGATVLDPKSKMRYFLNAL